MRFTTVESTDGARVALVEDATVYPLPTDDTLTGLLAADALTDAARRAKAASSGTPLADVTLAPLLRPPAMRDFLTYEQHVRALAGEVPPAWYAEPGFYFTNPAAVLAPFGDVAIPPGAARFDFELEVAAVIGREGRDLTPEQAAEHIAGYTIFNDWSARDLQTRELTLPLGPSKSKDTATTLGPWLVTPDELEPYRRGDRLALRARVWLDEHDLGGDSTENMAWSFEQLVAYASRGTVVRPGDVLGSGTCGNGCLAERWANGLTEPGPLRPGSTVRIEVEGIGTIENRVVGGAAPLVITPARTAVPR